MKKLNVVFVCLANYCRSPMAEGIFTTLVKRDGHASAFKISSAGTKDWDVGLRPDARGLRLLAQHNYQLSPNKRAQIITADEISNADFILAMSQRVADELGNGENVHLLLDFAPEFPSKDIPDPYPSDTFPEAFHLIEHGVKAFYAYLKREGLIPG
jgi:protein-tyrosine phosphatase